MPRLTVKPWRRGADGMSVGDVLRADVATRPQALAVESTGSARPWGVFPDTLWWWTAAEPQGRHVGTSLANTLASRRRRRHTLTHQPTGEQVLMVCRLVVADDHERVRSALKVLLGLEPDIEVVGEAANGQEAVEAVERLKPDVLMLDLTMPVMTGMEAIPHVREASPETRIVVLTMHRDADYMRKAFESGAVGYVVKSTADEEVVGAVREAF